MFDLAYSLCIVLNFVSQLLLIDIFWDLGSKDDTPPEEEGEHIYTVTTEEFDED